MLHLLPPLLSLFVPIKNGPEQTRSGNKGFHTIYSLDCNMRCKNCKDQQDVLFRILTSPLYFANLKCDSKVPVYQHNEARSIYYDHGRKKCKHVYAHLHRGRNRLKISKVKSYIEGEID
jgi:hypothetical protein